MDAYKAAYIVKYFRQFMLEEEVLAQANFFAIGKSRGDVEFESEPPLAVSVLAHFREQYSENKRVLELMNGGYQNFLARTAVRILETHPSQIWVNSCPKCGGVAKTPRAKQCRHCFHDWHEKALLKKKF